MSRKFFLSAEISKRNRFDVFGWFEKTGTLTAQEQALAAPALAKKWMDEHFKNLGLSSPSHKVKSYSVQNGKFTVTIETV